MEEELNTTREQRNDALMQVKTEREKKETAQAAHRQAAGRLYKQARKVGEVRKDEKTKYSAKLKEERAKLVAANREDQAAKEEALEAAAAERLAERELELQAEHGWLLEERRQAVNTARARA
eukprot:1069900-Prymnesium_polylepis.1